MRHVQIPTSPEPLQYTTTSRCPTIQVWTRMRRQEYVYCESSEPPSCRTLFALNPGGCPLSAQSVLETASYHTGRDSGRVGLEIQCKEVHDARPDGEIRPISNQRRLYFVGLDVFRL
jgi:hypothetical protein